MRSILTFFILLSIAVGLTAQPSNLLKKTDKRITKLDLNTSDLDIIISVDKMLKSVSDWNHNDDRLCIDDESNGQYSLYCALHHASIQLSGEFHHRSPTMELFRLLILNKKMRQIGIHPIMGWNNHAEIQFEDVEALLQEAMSIIRQRLEAKEK